MELGGGKNEHGENWYEILLLTILSVELENGDLSLPRPFILPQQMTKFNMKEYKERIIQTEESGRLIKKKEESNANHGRLAYFGP